MAEFDYQQLVKAAESFSPSRLIGKGSHGSVYKAILFQENKILAIKKSSFGYDLDNSKKLENEILVLSSLPKSPYVINFLGTSSCSQLCKSHKLLVMEFMPNGSLYDLLHVAKTPPTWAKRVEIALQIARAIQFLHEGKPLVIHRDIKSANVLFDSTWNAKLADYGLAVLQPESILSQPAGTIGYMDPCYTTASQLSTRNDVFSYGIVLLEIISGKKAIDVTKEPASIVEWAIPLIQKRREAEIFDTRMGLPPPFMEGTIKHLLCMAARCVSLKEENRPSISDVLMGMDSCLVQRVKVVPSWTSVIKNMILLKRQRKFAQNWHKGKYSSGHKFEDYGDISKGKLLLMEIFADFTFK